MRKKLALTFIFCAMCLSPVYGANESKHITVVANHERPPKDRRPHGPEKPMAEAWLDEEVLTIEFIEPQGEATLTLSSSATELESVTFTTDVPFTIDLTPYPEAESFTIETETGHSYIGYFY